MFYAQAQAFAQLLCHSVHLEVELFGDIVGGG